MAQRQQLLSHILKKFEANAPKQEESINKITKPLALTVEPPQKPEIAIIGGGIAGLFSGILLKQLGIPFTIFERDDRFGGRVFTKYYPKEDGKWQYAEVGAMRIPKEHDMFFQLVNFLNDNVKTEDKSSKIELIDYHFSDDNNLYYFNGTRDDKGKVMNKDYASQNPDKLGFPKILCFNNETDYKNNSTTENISLYIRKDLTAPRLVRWNNVAKLYDTIYEKLDADYAEFGEEEFISRYDQWNTSDWFNHQVREWLAEDMHELPNEITINALVNAVGHYAELLDSATGLNHLALVESVIDRKNFSGSKWFTIQGGMQRLPDAMVKYLHSETAGSGHVEKNAGVFKLERTKDGKVAVHWVSGTTKQAPRVFDRVIVTAPFGSVRYWDMPSFSYLKRQAIRSLNYDHSTKIFLRFQNRFWEKIERPIHGGSTKTDLPVRTVVYPSYGIGSQEKGVILASYTWATDAIRWSLPKDNEIKAVCLANLSTLHDQNLEKIFIEEDLIIQKWYEAFALFEPRQLVDLLIPGMFPEQRIHFAGEHLSTSHAWIVGALYSAHRAVKEILYLQGLVNEVGVISQWEKFSEWNHAGAEWQQWIHMITSMKTTYHNH